MEILSCAMTRKHGILFTYICYKKYTKELLYPQKSDFLFRVNNIYNREVKTSYFLYSYGIIFFFYTGL